MKRTQLSSPIKLAINSGILQPSLTFLDYGCGKGGDVERLRELGYVANGYDPYYFPDTPLEPADIVGLNYVLGVIEDADERLEVLKNAWNLTKKTLIISTQVQHTRGKIPHNDGFLTKWKTFEKFWTSPAFKSYVEEVTGIKPKRLGKGIAYVVKPEL